MRDFGVEKSCVVYADSTAALAIAKRKGAGKIRHINISCLWIQERADSKQLEMRKVLGTENPADMMTKHLARQPLDKCMLQLNQHRATGRAKTGLQVQGTGGTKAEPTGSPGAPVGGAEGREQPAAQSPSKGPSGTRLSSLRVCMAGPSQAPCSPVADEQPDQAVIFQGGRQGHKRRGAENISVRESTCPSIGWPGRKGYIEG